MEDDYTSAENSPTIYYDSDMTYKSSLSYQSYVNALCTRIPSLMTLSQFLSEPKTPSSGRICAIDFLVGLDQPEIRTDIKSNELKRFIRDEPKRETFRGEVEALEGRILLIEDLSRDIVELLGSELAIDPLFFALHLHTVRRTGSRHQTPDEATLPSRLSSRDFINVSYHRALVSDTATPHKSRFLRTCKVGRKLVFLRSTRIALAQHGASLIRIKNRLGSWLGK